MAKKNETVEKVETPEVKVAPEETVAPEVKVTADESEKNVEPTEEPTAEEKSIEQLADETERGTHGSGGDRMRNLGANYVKVQAEVNRRYKESIKL